ncbi:MAG: mtnN [Bacillales bacterium]|nr:mtnN [Bacillales bacterium]
MKIGIIGAMEEEVALLKENIEITDEVTVGTCRYYIGKMHGVEVVLLLSGIGKVNAAMSTAILLEKFKPDYIINAGSAGGFSKGLKVGDIVISTEVVHHDVDITAFGYVHGQVAQLPPTYQADEKLLELAFEIASKIEGVNAEKGLIASGDIFIHTPEQRATIHGHFPELKAGEMEAAAVAQVAFQFNVPFVIARSLSDIAGDNSGISFDKYIKKAAENSATLIIEMVKRLK